MNNPKTPLEKHPPPTPIRNSQHRIHCKCPPHSSHANGSCQCRDAWSSTHVVSCTRHGSRKERGGRLDWSRVLIKFKIIRQPLIQTVQNCSRPHHISQAAPVPPTVIQNAVQFHLPPTARRLGQPLPQSVQSPDGHAEHVGNSRVGEHGRYYAASLLIVVQVVGLGGGRGGKGGGGYAERGGNRRELNIGSVKIGDGRVGGAIIVVRGGSSTAGS
mmetsp:Transcript_39745/g.95620  ORF Transcript_39745/g.95620 Transcript_39745/m.95620 type:complete len:215 (+) Transcript_39745:1621-2265(+)